ncbi:MAG: 4Fe-4S dicluster domain-containing protein [Magnetospirillum sp. WYHS-4]
MTDTLDRAKEPEMDFDVARRRFLSGGAALGTLALAPGVTLFAFPAEAKPAHEATSGSVRWGLLVDITKCEPECNTCVKACKAENGWHGFDRPKTDVQWIRKVNVRDPKSGRKFSLPIMCQHCTAPTCVDVCPTGASFKRVDGVVLVDKHLCIGCRYCMMACPYKARSFVHEAIDDQKPHAPRGKGTVDACTLCVHRIDQGRIPACAEACLKDGHGAILFGDLNDPTSEIHKRVATIATTQIRADLGLDPGVRYHGI